MCCRHCVHVSYSQASSSARLASSVNVVVSVTCGARVGGAFNDLSGVTCLGTTCGSAAWSGAREVHWLMRSRWCRPAVPMHSLRDVKLHMRKELLAQENAVGPRRLRLKLQKVVLLRMNLPSAVSYWNAHDVNARHLGPDVVENG